MASTDVANSVKSYGSIRRIPAAATPNMRNDMYLASDAIRLLAALLGVRMNRGEALRSMATSSRRRTGIFKMLSMFKAPHDFTSDCLGRTQHMDRAVTGRRVLRHSVLSHSLPGEHHGRSTGVCNSSQPF